MSTVNERFDEIFIHDILLAEFEDEWTRDLFEQFDNI